VLAIGARFVPPRPATLIQPPNEINYGGLRLLGYRLEQGPDSLTIYPYWQVDERTAPGLRMRWSILDSDGRYWQE
jgi:hypothetical protein